jgi:hypothetical protein
MSITVSPLGGGIDATIPATTRWVDSVNGDEGNDGSAHSPLKTIQAAINSLGGPVDAADELKPRQIFVYGGAYDENLTIPAAGVWMLIALGHVTLGDGTVQYISSSTPRNITWANDQALEFSNVRPSLILTQAFGGFYAGSTHMAYVSTGWDISGNITITGSVAFTSTECYLYGVKVRGNFNASGKTGTLTLMLDKSYIIGTFTGNSSSRIDYCRDTEFDGLITVTNLGQIVNCDIGGGITFTNFSNAGIALTGFFGCRVAGTLTCATAGAYRADGTTQALNTPTLSGGITLTDLA